MQFYYRLMAQGKKSFWNIFGIGLVKLSEPKDAIYYTDERYVFADNEEQAREMIREKLKSKYSGFVITREK